MYPWKPAPPRIPPSSRLFVEYPWAADATRLLGSTLGVAIIGSVYASIYASRLTAALPSALPAHQARAAHDSAGAALTVAGRLASTGHASLAANLHHAASHAFFGGFSAGCLVAAELDDVQVVVNNAGVLHVAVPPSASLDAARVELETNYLGLVSMTHAFA